VTNPTPRAHGSTASGFPDFDGPGTRGSGVPARSVYAEGGGANLADILERVLDKGIVIAGDIRINLLDIELLTIKLRLLVASVDRAREMGIDWWEHDPALSSGAAKREEREQRALAEENRELRARLAALEAGAADRVAPASSAAAPPAVPATGYGTGEYGAAEAEEEHKR
jgi:hypothetical protein